MIKTKTALCLMLLACSLTVQSQAPVVDDSDQFIIAEVDEQHFEAPLSKAQVDDSDENAIAYDEPEQAESPRPVAGEDGAMNDVQLIDKIQRLQQEVQELRGLVEVQAHDLKMLQQQQIAFYKDIDNRLRTGDRDNAAQAGVRDTSNIKRDVNEDATVLKQSSQKPVAARSNSNPADEQISYLAAYDLIKNRHYDQAISAMQKFIDKYPQGGYIANAHYWLGELYLVKSNKEKAITEFEIVLNKHATSSKAAPSLLKLAFALADNGQYDQAKKRLQEVIQKYPDTKTASLASEKLEQLRR